MLVLPATHQLWQPRNGQWWRRPRWRAPLEWFAGHLQYGSGTGHLLFSSTGHLVNECGYPAGCCFVAGSRTVTIAGTGIVLNDCLIPTGYSGVGSVKFADTAFDGTDSPFITSIDAGSTCLFSSMISTSRSWDTHSGTTCSSVLSFGKSTNTKMTFYRTGADAGRFFLQVYVDGTNWLFADGWSDLTYSAADCTTGVTTISFTSMTKYYTGANAPEFYIS